MIAWEYQDVRFSDRRELLEAINQVGQSGWEFVEIITHPGPFTEGIAFMRRQANKEQTNG
jgi:hypothetical protein